MTRDEYFRNSFSYDPAIGVVTRHTARTKPFGVKTAKGYLYFNGVYPAMAHQIAWFLHFGAWPGSGLDHINGSKSDNRISNLRKASQHQNMGNVGKYRNNTSGFKGVWFDSRRKSKRWAASITIHGKQKNLGRFLTPEEAHAAYTVAAKAAFGPFARMA